MTDFSVSNAHTIIGATRFHDRVRDGIEWFPRAKVARRKGMEGAGTKCIDWNRLNGSPVLRGREPRPHALGVAGSSRTVN